MGKMTTRLIDLSGKRYGRLLVLQRGENNKQGHPQWVCRCDCGASRTVSGCNLKTGNSESCGCLKSEAARSRRLLRPYEATYRSMVRNTPHSVRISYEDFLKFTLVTECHYCGAAIRWGQESKDGLAYNLDRKDCSRGYRKGNIVVCCARCNWAKGDHFTYHEWMQIAAVIRTWK